MPVRSTHRQRGSVYLMVLGASMLVTIIGVSALLAVRVQQRATASVGSAEQAEMLALAAIDQALDRIGRDANWRSRYTHNVWVGKQALAGGEFSFKITDEADGDLTNDDAQPVRIYGLGKIEEAVRLVSVEVAMKDAPSYNLLTNPSADLGTTGWTGGTGAVVTADLTHYRTGPASLRASARTSAAAGPTQDITTKLQNGTTYHTEFWLNGLGNNAHRFRARLEYTSTIDGTRTIDLTPWVSLSSTWNIISGDATVSWAGTLLSARWYVESDAHMHDFAIDDAVMVDPDAVRHAYPVPGTWRSEVR